MITLSIEETRARIVELAREWIGTPYRHQCRIKGEAADCTFFAKVYEEAGLIPFVEIAPYSPTAHLNRAARVYMATIEQFAVEVEAPEPGDIVMFFIGRDWSHGGVVTEWPEMIHGDQEAGAIVLGRADQGRMAGLTGDKRRFMSFVSAEK